MEEEPERDGYDHEALVAAVVGGDAPKAAAIMEGHVMRTATKVTEFLRTVRDVAPAPPAPDWITDGPRSTAKRGDQP